MSFEKQKKRKTIANTISCSGIGPWSGEICKTTLKPAECGVGIVFCGDNGCIRVGKPGVEYNTDKLNTTMICDGFEIKMVEHLLSALIAFGITDIVVRVEGDEVPMLDGSAYYWTRAIKTAGIKEFAEVVKPVELKNEIKIEADDKYIIARPCDRLVINYKIVFDNSTIGTQEFTFDEAKNVYSKDISMARTFCTEEQVENHKKIKKHFNDKDMLIFGKTLMPKDLRYPNEPVRHKILDLIGDISGQGHFINAEFECYKAGHAMHRAIVEEILKQNLIGE